VDDGFPYKEFSRFPSIEPGMAMCAGEACFCDVIATPGVARPFAGLFPERGQNGA